MDKFNYLALYAEINLASIIVVALIRIRTQGLSKMMSQRNFANAIDSEIVFFLSDTICKLMINGMIPFNQTVFLFFKDVYFFSTALMCYFWFIYFECMQESEFSKNEKAIRLSAFFVLVVLVLIIVNIFNGCLYHFDEFGKYVRGPLFIALYVFSYAYVLVTCFRAFIGIFNKEKAHLRKKLISLSLFPIAPGISGWIQFVYPDIPLACVTLSLATLILYLNWIEEIISVDPLTRLNNRKQLEYHFNNWRKNGDDKMYLLMIDADKFKSINDAYGHIEGDNALLRISESLKKACTSTKRRSNIARFGGDEFVVFAACDNEEDVKDLINRIREILKETNSNCLAPYELTVSIGYIEADKETKLENLIKKADVALYNDKNNK